MSYSRIHLTMSFIPLFFLFLPPNKNVYTFSHSPSKNLEHFSLRMCKTFSSFPVPVVFLLPAEHPLCALLRPWRPVGNSWIISKSWGSQVRDSEAIWTYQWMLPKGSCCPAPQPSQFPHGSCWSTRWALIGTAAGLLLRDI